MTDEKQCEGLVGPIEAGKTSAMPVTPTDGEMALEDHYYLDCKELEMQPKNIILPKFIFKPSVGYKDKSLLLLTYDRAQQMGVCSSVMNASVNGIKKLRILFLDEEEEEILSVWNFENARIHAVDFGTLAKQRTDQAEVAVEIDFTHLSIDGEVI